MKFLILNGPNLNLLGRREPEVYGTRDYAALCAFVTAQARAQGDGVCCVQSNHEGVLIDQIQGAEGAYDGIVLNPGAYSHTSYAIYDALRAITVPAVEVHLSDILKREEFRARSLTAPACIAQIVGHGFDGYAEAMALLRAAK